MYICMYVFMYVCIQITSKINLHVSLLQFLSVFFFSLLMSSDGLDFLQAQTLHPIV